MTIRKAGFGVMAVVVLMQSLWIGNTLVGISGDPWWMWAIFAFGVGMATTSQEQWAKMVAGAKVLNSGDERYDAYDGMPEGRTGVGS